jgi:hypothetical protein
MHHGTRMHARNASHHEALYLIEKLHMLVQGSLLFVQAAAVGWSHTAVLRHILAGALVRARRPPLPPPIEPTARNPETLSQCEDFHASVSSRLTNMTQEMKELHGDDWPASWEEEQGGSTSAIATGSASRTVWMQPGSILQPEISRLHDTREDTHRRLGPLGSLSELVTSERASGFTELESDAFEQLHDAWEPEEMDSTMQDSEEHDEAAASSDIEASSQVGLLNRPLNLAERATQLGVSALKLYEEDMERVAEEVAEEVILDGPGVLESPGLGLATEEGLSDGFGAMHDLPDASVPTQSGMHAVMGDLADDSENESEQVHVRVGEFGAAGQRQKVYVLCGGDTAERDVSLQSGVTVSSTNTICFLLAFALTCTT